MTRVIGLQVFLGYASIEKILESNSFFELEGKMKKSFSEKAAGALLNLFWKEFQFQHSFRRVEQSLCTYCETVQKNSDFKNSEAAKEYIIQKIFRNKRFKTLHEAEQLLISETHGNDERIYTPHVLFLVSGFSMGIFIDFIRTHVKHSERKTDLIDLLSEVNKRRNLITHNVFSSRVNSIDNIETALTLTNKIYDFLKVYNGY
jgi:hypothetical protein